MKGGAPLTRGQKTKLTNMGYTVTISKGMYIITGVPKKLLINTRLSRDLRKDARLETFKTYINNLLRNDKNIPNNITDMACKYISGCDLEINETAQIIMSRLNPQADALEIQKFQDRTKKIGSFQDTSDGLKDLRDIQEVVFNELPRPPLPPLPQDPGSKRKEREEPQPQVQPQLQLHPLTLYKYVIIRELDGTFKIYYSCAQGLYHFSYIDYHVKKNYNRDGTPRVNAQGQRTPATNLFFVKNTSIPEKILFSMSWGNTRVRDEWFSLLRDFALQNAQNINDFVIANINRYQNVFNAFGGDLAAIINQIQSLGNIADYANYENEWNTVIMGSEISHSCLTYALEVMGAGEFCTDKDGNIYYVDGWSGHFKTPQDYIHGIMEVFHLYGYTDLQIFLNHLARNQYDVKCRDETAANCNSQLTRGVTMKKVKAN
jgi:hypothetical protein